jgi:hypothetical protein
LTRASCCSDGLLLMADDQPRPRGYTCTRLARSSFGVRFFIRGHPERSEGPHGRIFVTHIACVILPPIERSFAALRMTYG